MNALEKALLIKELHHLLDDLEHRSLSFFEIAKSKSRLIEIFRLCDEPIFKKQILKFKSQTQPEQAATDFADQTLFKLSYRGLFRQDRILQQALYQNTESGWAILYHPAQGWQIWLIPAPNRSALISHWGGLDDIYHWMLEQQQHYSCLKTDDELKQKPVLLDQPIAPTLTETETNLNLSIPAIQQQNQINEPSLIKSQVDIPYAHEPMPPLDSIIQPGDAQIIHELPQRSEDDQQAIPAITAQAPLRAEKLSKKDCPQSVKLGSYIAHIHPLHEENSSAQALYVLEIPGLPEISQYLDLLIHASDLQNWQQRPIYLAEQINSQGCFIKYLALLGAENQVQAIPLMNGFTGQSQHHIAAIKEIHWEDLAENFTDFEALFYSYTQKAALIWTGENYIPFIPTQLFQTQKFIQFEESPADFKTPLLLLKDRQKIRVIHGQKRLGLSRTESAYPYFLLERQHGISWQLIQNIITQLKSPIDCYQLYKAIQKHISD
ncbi:hypothetical protein [Acinetobacter sp. ANC 5378]|uniref:hypothetical protein n=1 Tax=Acinetobacter sp. ANC 5378 TaxID=2731249 RepID=UPI00148F7D9A|nr:hypothetical protein [Acinetobacter sp. ANC 5378]NNG81091.1 hypothetical protein [Acinetobacter sp. ANC 5378]